MVTILLAVSMIVVIVLGYLVWNLTRKNRVLGDFIVQSHIKIRSTYQEMKEIDAAGAFESDDEVGAVFSALFGLLEECVMFITEYLEDVDVGEDVSVVEKYE